MPRLLLYFYSVSGNGSGDADAVAGPGEDVTDYGKWHENANANVVSNRKWHGHANANANVVSNRKLMEMQMQMQL